MITVLDSILLSWQYNQEINNKLLSSIQDEWLTDRAISRGRNVREQIAHIHNVRLMWLEAKSISPEDGCKKINREDVLSLTDLNHQLRLSAKSMNRLFEKIGPGFKAKGKQVDITRFFTYLIAHESHHRGQIILHLKLCGHTLPKEMKFSMWDL